MKRLGFTLIELLIVVAIIAILAAIAVPNLLEAQVRSKSARTKADIRTIVTALESYRVDYNMYINPWPKSMYGSPLPGATPSNPVPEKAEYLYYKNTRTGIADGNGFGLTSPVAYITSFPVDPFPEPQWQQHGYNNVSYHYHSFGSQKTGNWSYEHGGITWTYIDISYLLRGVGPDKRTWGNTSDPYYDPTNGTVSAGDIWYIGPLGFRGGTGN
jgi:prepilin-type N-terminal cleavage/methylation domain-containing protein